MPHIRPYRHEDWPSYIKLDLQTGLTSMIDATHEQKEFFLKQWSNQLKKKYGWTDIGPTLDNSLLLILDDDDGKYAGHLWISEQQDLFTDVRKMFITTVAIAPQYRGRGWGKLLMHQADKEAVRRGLDRIVLAVSATNERAINLYSQLDYKVVRLVMERSL